MNKAVLISIRPEWCDLIVRGKKTIEVRKTRPKLETPFKVYIYCTKAPQHLITIFKDGEEIEDGEIHHGKPMFLKCDKYLPDGIRDKTQMVIGEFICDKIDRLAHVGTTGSSEPAKLYIETPDLQYEYADELLRAACLSEAAVEGYLKGGDGFGWHISDLKIYDQPKPLSSFSRYDFRGMNGTDVCGNEACEHYQPSGSYMLPPTCAINGCYLSKPPQSWCYIATAEEDV